MRTGDLMRRDASATPFNAVLNGFGRRCRRGRARSTLRKRGALRQPRSASAATAAGPDVPALQALLQAFLESAAFHSAHPLRTFVRSPRPRAVSRA